MPAMIADYASCVDRKLQSDSSASNSSIVVSRSLHLGTFESPSPRQAIEMAEFNSRFGGRDVMNVRESWLRSSGGACADVKCCPYGLYRKQAVILAWCCLIA